MVIYFLRLTGLRSDLQLSKWGKRGRDVIGWWAAGTIFRVVLDPCCSMNPFRLCEESVGLYIVFS